jgi:6-phosphogluconolactonase (cycloisomerase 2 family)
VIQGPKVGLDIPLGISYDTVSNQIVVPNAGDESILFFDVNANGDVAPVRVLKGAKTALSGPSSVAIDGKRNEIWVANWNNHTATVYPRTAMGDMAPLRVIRAAPKGTLAPGFGRPGTVAFDPKRKEILVPN